MVALAAILSYVSYAPLWLIGHLQISKVAFSLLFGLNACAGIFCSFTAPILINRYGNRTLVFIALSCMLGAALLLMVFNSLFNFQGFNAALAFMLPIILLSAGLSFALGPATSMALSQFGDRAGSASALLGFTQMVGASVITFLVQQTDLIAPLAVATVLVIFVLPLWLIMLLSKYSHWNDERSAQP
jgi:DHA1 family bicyclomycin/chloramphenicol resistance-like MFS transporter